MTWSAFVDWKRPCLSCFRSSLLPVDKIRPLVKVGELGRRVFKKRSLPHMWQVAWLNEVLIPELKSKEH